MALGRLQRAVRLSFQPGTSFVGLLLTLGFRGSRSLDKLPSTNKCYDMAMETKVRKIGNSLGIVLPKEAIHAMQVEEGATLYLTETPENGLRVTPNQPGFKEKMEIADSLMRRYRNALRELAK